LSRMAPKASQQKPTLGGRGEDADISGGEDGFGTYHPLAVQEMFVLLTSTVSLAPGHAATAKRDQSTKTKTKPQKPTDVHDGLEIEGNGHDDAYLKTRMEMRRLLSGDAGSSKIGRDGKRKVKENREVAGTAEKQVGEEKEEALRTKKSKRTREMEETEAAEGDELVSPKKAKKMPKVAFAEDAEEEEEIIVSRSRPRRCRRMHLLRTPRRRRRSSSSSPRRPRRVLRRRSPEPSATSLPSSTSQPPAPPA